MFQGVFYRLDDTHAVHQLNAATGQRRLHLLVHARAAAREAVYGAEDVVTDLARMRVEEGNDIGEDRPHIFAAGIGFEPRLVREHPPVSAGDIEAD